MSSGGYFVPGKPGWVGRNLNESAAAQSILRARSVLLESEINRRSPTVRVRWNTTGGLRPSPFGPIAQLQTTSSIWHIIEYANGAVRSPAYRLLSRSAEALGLTWVSS